MWSKVVSFGTIVLTLIMLRMSRRSKRGPQVYLSTVKNRCAGKKANFLIGQKF